MNDYIGIRRIPLFAGILTLNQHQASATAGQTVFTLPFLYTADGNHLWVFLNGQKLTVTTDYTETSTSSVTLAAPAALNDVLEFAGW
jgi:hypothetical protein